MHRTMAGFSMGTTRPRYFTCGSSDTFAEFGSRPRRDLALSRRSTHSAVGTWRTELDVGLELVVARDPFASWRSGAAVASSGSPGPGRSASTGPRSGGRCSLKPSWACRRPRARWRVPVSSRFAQAGVEIDRGRDRAGADRLEREQAHVECWPAGAETLNESGARAAERRDGHGQIRGGACDARRRIAGLPGQRHEAAHALGDRVVAWPLRVWPRLAEAGDGGVDHARD